MKQEKVNELIKEQEAKKAMFWATMKDTVENEWYLEKEDKENILQYFSTKSFQFSSYDWAGRGAILKINKQRRDRYETSVDKLRELISSLSYFIWKANGQIEYLNRLVDSEPMDFTDGIIITDPCYITKDDDWKKCEYGERMDLIGINHCMTRDTLYGDWSCDVMLKRPDKTEEKVGEFCADAGLVCVASFKEVVDYYPKFLNRNSWTYTAFENFEGTVQFVVVKEGDEYAVRVVGKGTDKVTGEPIEFYSLQSGF